MAKTHSQNCPNLLLLLFFSSCITLALSQDCEIKFCNSCKPGYSEICEKCKNGYWRLSTGKKVNRIKSDGTVIIGAYTKYGCYPKNDVLQFLLTSILSVMFLILFGALVVRRWLVRRIFLENRVNDNSGEFDQSLESEISDYNKILDQNSSGVTSGLLWDRKRAKGQNFNDSRIDFDKVKDLMEVEYEDEQEEDEKENSFTKKNERLDIL